MPGSKESLDSQTEQRNDDDFERDTDSNAEDDFESDTVSDDGFESDTVSDDGFKSDTVSDDGFDSNGKDSEASFDDVEDSDDELSSDIEPTPKKKKPAKKRAPAITCNIVQTAPKIEALLAAIDEMKPGKKGVIFSQFTTFLNHIEKELCTKGHTLTRSHAMVQ